MRPPQLIGVIGTHTEVGKTWVTAQLARALRARGHTVAARKPVQSFELGAVTDAEVLAAATGEAPDAICLARRSLPIPLAPPMAADQLGRERIALASLVDDIHWPPVDFGFVETVGGALSPIAHDGASIDLLNALQPDRVLVVSDAGLGTVNAVRLTLRAAYRYDAMVFLNRFDAAIDVHRLNRLWLVERDGLRVVTDIGALADTLARTSLERSARSGGRR